MCSLLIDPSGQPLTTPPHRPQAPPQASVEDLAREIESRADDPSAEPLVPVVHPMTLQAFLADRQKVQGGDFKIVMEKMNRENPVLLHLMSILHGAIDNQIESAKQAMRMRGLLPPGNIGVPVDLAKSVVADAIIATHTLIWLQAQKDFDNRVKCPNCSRVFVSPTFPVACPTCSKVIPAPR
jgi:hypothetical protein